MLVRLIGFGILAYGVYMLTSQQARTAIISSYDTMPEPDADVDVVARTIWGEARGEGVTGMTAVANVIANRVAHPGWWGRGWRGVCLAPYQFSAWNANDPNLVKLSTVTTADPSFAAAVEIAAGAVYGTLADVTGGATHYHTLNIHPAWADELTQTARIGSHVFYA
ncbi:cell wall hydrolase [Paramagnetospirillum magneticum]|uniref:Cell wall hydrolyses involved in spore germination n=1 Tax=Paramagnetospirillum magneticum (strain ATCC 700264 / AMB-1) TaxID=342108 RepID=Q2W4K9_PARM1|nr:cell wall hydrolase [Paramagnetospirillum magneticum]BAE51216.1 Cell wall hydrolyses involved in spore germination [Paramagnetospirillum magneticum AMB-1]